MSAIQSTHDSSSIDTGILLEVGTDEFEVLRFELAGKFYGINVAKLREVVLPPEIRRAERGHPAFEGVFLLRGRMVPLFNMRTVLGLQAQTEAELARPRSSLILVAEFNLDVSAYRVDAVERVWRVSSEQLEAMPAYRSLDQVPITSMVRIDGQILPMLDFEAIYNEATGNKMVAPKLNAPMASLRKARSIAIAEDSVSIRNVLTAALEESGYQLAHVFENGKVAWEWLQAHPVDLLITDIEMPQMDGLQLCRKIREDGKLKDLPVVLFSSLVTHGNRVKGEAVGATAQISKPQLDQLIEMLDGILHIGGKTRPKA